ncbi:putative sushi, von Willebrand factor type A [Apostichopus japonicus]|uniref:Putative sushi, von Willebrand factor type A n=1 Tax=Stichopus japonicus TaxID=307972 RepID=A0A2G8KAP9_STIJA|nr:putative sushi, von Willebrand factor type A [Apostichopus japonicus]
MIFIKGEHLHSVCSSSSTRLYIFFGFVLSFIRTTYGDCLSPPTYVNADRLLSDDFSVGSSMVYFCESGYVMAGNADNVLLICSSDELWIGPSIDCSKKISCSLPPFPAYGSFSVIDPMYSFQSSTKFECESGYLLDGSTISECSSNGQWTENKKPIDEPICKKSCKDEKNRYLNHECYELGSNTGNWEYAKLQCDSNRGRLATIKDSHRQSFVKDLLIGETFLTWIGGYELDRDWKYPSGV